MARLSYISICSIVTLVVVGSALAAPASRIAARGVTQSQQHVVDQLNAYRAQLDAANAQWQAASIAALQNGEAPPAFPDVPAPDISAPGYDDGDEGTTSTDEGTSTSDDGTATADDSGDSTDSFGSNNAPESPAETAAGQSQATPLMSNGLLKAF